MLDIFRTLPGIFDDVEGAEMVRDAVVFAAWRRIAGDGLAEQTAPLRLEKGRLFIAVSNRMWQRQLKDLCGQMVFRLNAAIGTTAVNFIELQIDALAVESARSQKRTWDEDELRSNAEKEISPELAQAAEGIADEDLRRQFLLAAGSCLVRRKISNRE
ncbi:MAG: DciA family protein [Pyrinomonadaceae bacterium]